VNFHDNDLIPIDATPADRDRIVREFKAALAETGLVVPMATTSLFKHPAFKDGAVTSNDARVRAFALQKTINAIDLGVELGAKVLAHGVSRTSGSTSLRLSFSWECAKTQDHKERLLYHAPVARFCRPQCLELNFTRVRLTWIFFLRQHWPLLKVVSYKILYETTSARPPNTRRKTPIEIGYMEKMRHRCRCLT
jgi:hypothetical protein